jgi:hypothetical protein
MEAIESHATKLVVARQNQAAAPVPRGRAGAATKAIPFLDIAFDSAVASLVFCSL